jgi:tetraacyldisaccharide 4'-kinase
VKVSLAAYWRGLASGTRNDLPAGLVRVLLVPPSLAYALFQCLRARLYRAGVLKSKRLPRPVISVGNIAVGGTGKTPVTAYIARLLLAQGLRVVVLSRGYGGSREGQVMVVSDGNTIFLSANECGDEPVLLARTIPGLMVVIGSDRHAAGLLALERLNPDVFLLDDGFQHLRLQSDLNILLLDYARPFGNGWCLPAGLLREPESASLRADLVILTRCPDRAVVTAAVPGRPQCCARHLLGVAVPLAGGESLRLAAMRGKKLLAFAGIAEPGAFFDGLRSHGLDLVATINFPDHAVYDDAAIQEIMDRFATSGADMAITTEKDGVKLNALPMGLSEKTVLARLDLAIDDPTPLTVLLRNLLQK